MRLTDLTPDLTGPVRALMAAGAPFVRARDASDYWLYATHFATTCPVVLDDDGAVVAAAIAMQSQTRRGEIYLQDLMVDTEHRRLGLAGLLVNRLRDVAAERGCTRITLTSEAANQAAHQTWLRLGFTNRPGDRTTADGVEELTDYKGIGKHRAVYDLDLKPRRSA